MAIRKFETDCVLTNPNIALRDKFIECTSDSLYGSKKNTFRLINAKYYEDGNIARQKKRKIESLTTTNSDADDPITTLAESYNDTDDGEDTTTTTMTTTTTITMMIIILTMTMNYRSENKICYSKI